MVLLTLATGTVYIAYIYRDYARVVLSYRQGGSTLGYLCVNLVLRWYNFCSRLERWELKARCPPNVVPCENKSRLKQYDSTFLRTLGELVYRVVMSPPHGSVNRLPLLLPSVFEQVEKPSNNKHEKGNIPETTCNKGSEGKVEDSNECLGFQRAP